MTLSELGTLQGRALIADRMAAIARRDGKRDADERAIAALVLREALAEAVSKLTAYELADYLLHYSKAGASL